MVSCLCFWGPESITTQRIKVKHLYSQLFLNYTRGRMRSLLLARLCLYSHPLANYKRGRMRSLLLTRLCVCLYTSVS